MSVIRKDSGDRKAMPTYSAAALPVVTYKRLPFAHWRAVLRPTRASPGNCHPASKVATGSHGCAIIPGMGTAAVQIPCASETDEPALIELVARAMHSSASEWLFFRELRAGTGRQNGGAQRL